MHLFKSNFGAAACGLAVALILLTPSAARSDEWNLLTTFSINHPFSVPGKVLEPNTKYVIKLLDLSGTRNVIQIFNEDRSELITTFIAASNYRLDPQDTTTFEFIETDPGYPKPIRSWFYPGRLNGYEFMYPKDQALDIVAHSRQGVLTANGRVDIDDLETFEVAAVEPGEVMAVEQTTERITATETDNETQKATDTEVTREKPANAVEPATEAEPADVDALEPEYTEPAAAQDESDMDEEEVAIDQEPEERLPDTAGELPLIGLIGALSAGIALFVKTRFNR
ncbi:MAG: hypothetical protein HY646_14320 [Acidobacteria bacterium]|nr:hypothetical protein [Acidobacteriota bacterium]